MTTLSAQETQFIKTGSTMAVAGYGNNPPGIGWTPIDNQLLSSVATSSGFQASVWVNSGTQQIWVAIAGTNDFKDVASWSAAKQRCYEMTMTISQAGALFIAEKEAFKANAYQDQAGAWTIG